MAPMQVVYQKLCHMLTHYLAIAAGNVRHACMFKTLTIRMHSYIANLYVPQVNSCQK